ncbi:MAG: hypothetical protein WBQ08_03185 [Candidatus Sulfotelmatobacter sp.]
MKSDRTNKPKNEQRVELKYCEGCGGLGIRECGGGQVYCNDCVRKMAELPVSRTPSRRPILPVGRSSVLDKCADSSELRSNQPDPDDSDSEDLDSEDSGPEDLDAMAKIATCFALRIAAAGGAA